MISLYGKYHSLWSSKHEKNIFRKDNLKMDKKDLRALYVMAGSMAAYWVFCFGIVAQSF